MNLALLLKQPLLKKHLFKQLAYYANGWYVFENTQPEQGVTNEKNSEQYTFKEVTSCNAKFVIVAKTHYRQSQQSYTSVSKKELQQILALQKNNENSASSIFQVVTNSAIDGYDVKKITIDADLLKALGKQRLLIPETELFGLYQRDKNIISNEHTWLSSLETPAGTLFASCFAGKSVNAYAKGLIATIEAFTLTAGVPSELSPTYIDKKDYATFIINNLFLQTLPGFFNKVAFNVKSWFKAKELHLLYWVPLLTAIAFYLLSNSYLWLKSNNIENELASQGSEVTQLLHNKVQQDQQRHLLNFLNSEFSKTTTVHKHWSLVYQLVESGMVINRLTFAKNVISIRGKAPNASNVLTNIAKNPQLSSASFKGAVNKSKGKDTFSLELVPKNVKEKVVL